MKRNKNHSNGDKTQKLKLCKLLKYDKSQLLKKKTLKWSFNKNILTP